MIKRCRQYGEDREVFVIGWPFPNNDAIVAILCEECGYTYYTSLENRNLAIERDMLVNCLKCAKLLADKENRPLQAAGIVDKGKIIKPFHE